MLEGHPSAHVQKKKHYPYCVRSSSELSVAAFPSCFKSDSNPFFSQVTREMLNCLKNKIFVTKWCFRRCGELPWSFAPPFYSAMCTSKTGILSFLLLFSTSVRTRFMRPAVAPTRTRVYVSLSFQRIASCNTICNSFSYSTDDALRIMLSSRLQKIRPLPFLRWRMQVLLQLTCCLLVSTFYPHVRAANGETSELVEVLLDETVYSAVVVTIDIPDGVSVDLSCDSGPQSVAGMNFLFCWSV